MLLPVTAAFLLSIPAALAGGMVVADPTLTINDVPFTTRAYWMRRANEALYTVTGSMCPFAAFGTVIVNHTASVEGELVCIGANSNGIVGNPTLHGEMAAIANCTKLLTDPSGAYALSPAEAQAAFADLSLYTNAESCPMCASAIQWSGFREYVYGTSIDTLIRRGWGQIRIASADVFRQSYDMGATPRMLAGVLANETDGYFAWQYDPARGCPRGCRRVEGVCSDERD